MVVQRTIDNLKDRPKDERQAVALGTAGAVVLILLVGWAFFFLKSLRTEQAQNAQPYAPDLTTPGYQDTPAPMQTAPSATDDFGMPNTNQ